MKKVFIDILRFHVCWHSSQPEDLSVEIYLVPLW